MKTKIITLILAFTLLASLMLTLASALTITSVTSNPAEVQPGEKVSLNLEVKNNFDADVTDVIVSLNLKDVPFAPYQSSSQVAYDEIREDRTKSIEFELITSSDAESGTYKIPVDISYYLDDEKKESSELVSLIVKAEAEISLGVEDGILIKGRETDLNIRVTNSGLGNAKLLSLELKTASGLRILTNSKVYLGDIDSDDFDTANFKVLINENAPFIVSLPVELSYRDSSNKEIKNTINLELKAYTEKQAIDLGLIKKNNTTIIIAGVIAIIVLYLIYRRIRKARKRRF